MILPLLVAGVALLVGLARRSAKADDTPHGGGAPGPEHHDDPGHAAAIADRVAAALASGDPDRMEALASEVSAQYPDAAADLRDAAMRARAKGGKGGKGGKPRRDEPRRDEPRRDVPEDAGRARALELTRYLGSIGGIDAKYKEDKEKVRAFQSAEGLTADGLYGPGSATRIMQSYGLVPVAPFYWSKKGGAAKQLQAFAALVRTARSADESRGAEYDQLMADTARSYRGPGKTGAPPGAPNLPRKGTEAWKLQKLKAAELRRNGWGTFADELERQLNA